jgi:polyketide biosynthesis acyl carrier protein
MTKESLMNLINDFTSAVAPKLALGRIKLQDSFKELGVNSIERMEITMLLLEEIEIDIPRQKLLIATNFEEMIDIILKEIKV